MISEIPLDEVAMHRAWQSQGNSVKHISQHGTPCNPTQGTTPKSKIMNGYEA